MAAHPIPIGSRGLRYLTGSKADAVLRAFVTDDLHKLDFTATLQWYARTARVLTDGHRAYLGCNDRYYLATVLLGRLDMGKPWLFERCREVEADPDGNLDLWARFHFKSSIITQTGTIQEIVIDPEITICILSQTASIARKFVTQIKDAMEKTPLLKRIYHDVFWQDPKKNAPRWSVDKGLVVKRVTNPKEATVEGHGLMDGMPTGSHFKLLNYDDLLDIKNVSNDDMIRKTTERFEMSDNLGVGEFTRKQMSGTRYSFADSYGQFMDRGIVKARLYPATKDGSLNGEPVLMSKAAWEKVKVTQRSTVAAQMLQNPLAGNENTFKIDWMRPFEIRPATMNVYIMADPSRGRNAKNDRTAIAVIGVDASENKYLLDGYRHRMKLSERWQAVKTLHQKWSKAPGVQYCEVGYERYGMQSDDEVFQEYMARDGYHFGITELNWPLEGGQSKKHRVERLEPDFRGSRFFLPALIWNGDMGGSCLWEVKDSKLEYRELTQDTKVMRHAKAQNQDWRIIRPIRRKDEDGNVYDVTRALIEEMIFFPFAPKDDLVDAASRIYDMQYVVPRLYESGMSRESALRPVGFVDA
jgi:hypothetical protein